MCQGCSWNGPRHVIAATTSRLILLDTRWCANPTPLPAGFGILTSCNDVLFPPFLRIDFLSALYRSLPLLLPSPEAAAFLLSLSLVDLRSSPVFSSRRPCFPCTQAERGGIALLEQPRGSRAAAHAGSFVAGGAQP